MKHVENKADLAYYFSPPNDIDPRDMETICRLVEAGGSVQPKWVRFNLKRAFLIGYVLDKGEIIACSSLKEPRPELIQSVKEQTGLDLGGYLERGYTSVKPGYRGLGIATRLLSGLTARAGERKIYSIIGQDNVGGQKIALNNRTRQVAVYESEKTGKKLGVWIPEWMID